MYGSGPVTSSSAPACSMEPEAGSSRSLRPYDISSDALYGTGGEELAVCQAYAMSLDASTILIANSNE
jgi:hypothetical protein